MRKHKKKLLIALLTAFIFIGLLVLKQLTLKAADVLLVVPNGYYGELTIKENVENGELPRANALENYGSYVYEFNDIDNAVVYVKDISPLMKAKKILASELNVAPITLTIISKRTKLGTVKVKLSPL